MGVVVYVLLALILTAESSYRRATTDATRIARTFVDLRQLN